MLIALSRFVRETGYRRCWPYPARWSGSLPYRQLSGGFTLIELVATIVLLGILGAVALPRFIDLGDEARKAVVQDAAAKLRTNITLIRSKARLAENLGSCRSAGASFAYNGGEVCMEPDLTGYPIGTTGMSGVSTNSEQLWELLITSPRIKDSNSPTNGWYETGAGGCGSTSFTYCWDFYSDGDRFRRLRYNDNGEGSIEIIDP